MLSWLLSRMVPSAAKVGWLTTTIPNRTAQLPLGYAYLFRGNGTFFTLGFGRLCDQLRMLGLQADDLTCHGIAWTYDQIISRQPSSPIILIGHSRGGRLCLNLANRLKLAGIFVDTIICIDVAFPPAVPANVRRAVHLYRSHWRLYPARPLTLSPDSASKLENLDLDHPEAPFPGRGLHHLNITAAESVQQWIVQQAQLLVQAPLPAEAHSP